MKSKTKTKGLKYNKRWNMQQFVQNTKQKDERFYNCELEGLIPISQSSNIQNVPQ